MHSTNPPSRPVPELTGRPFRLDEARDHGLTRKQLRGASYRRLTRSVYADRSVPAGREREVTGWMLVLPDDAALYGPTAAEWYELPTPKEDDCHVIVPAGGVVPVRRPGLVPHEGLMPDESQDWRGVRVTVPTRTFLDLAPALSRYALVAAGDAMVRLNLTTPDELQAAAAAARRKRGVVLARAAAELVRPGVDSPPETTVRLILIDGGLPCPETGVDIFDDAGGWIGRPDLAYLLLKLAIQYEGDVHRRTRKRWREDIARDEAMLDHGWEVIRVTGADLTRPAVLCHRVELRMARQAARLGVPLPPLSPPRGLR